MTNAFVIIKHVKTFELNTPENEKITPMFGVKYCQINLYQLLDELVMTLMHEGWKGYKPFIAIFRSMRSVDNIIIPIPLGYNKLTFELSKEYNFMWARL